MLKQICSIAVAVILTQQPVLALNMECVKGSSPGKDYKGSLTDLPELNRRKILGAWKHVDFDGINVSIELVNGSYYYVNRDRYCNSGKRGAKVRKVGTRFYSSDKRAGDYSEILADGMLGRFDNEGLIDKFTASASLHPQ